VLTRAERITRLEDRNSFDPRFDSPLGLVKVGNRKLAVKKKVKKKE
jgi:hypothetical protein